MPSNASLSKKYLLYALGFRAQTHAMLKMLLERYGEDHFCFTPSVEEAEILLVNGDSPDIESVVYSIRKNYLYPTIVMSTSRSENIPGATYLLNPLSPRLLIDTLQKITKNVVMKHNCHDIVPRLPTSFKNTSKDRTFSFSSNDIEKARKEWLYKKEVLKSKKTNLTARVLESEISSLDYKGGFLREINLADTNQIQNIYFQQEKTLSELLRRMLGNAAKNPLSILEVKINDKKILIDFFSNQWDGNCDENMLQSICINSLSASLKMSWIPREKTIKKDDMRRRKLEMNTVQTGLSSQQIIQDYRTKHAEFMLAQIGLWCSRGRLPKETDLNKPLHLRYWPNMPQLPRTPGAMRIAALWIAQPYSLAETIRLTGLKQRQVFAFYMICHSLLLFYELETLEKKHSTSQSFLKMNKEPLLKQKKTNAPKGFLQSLMSRIWSNYEEK